VRELTRLLEPSGRASAARVPGTVAAGVA
jgi:hypothetical protein